MLGLYLHLPFCRVHCTYCPFAISTDSSLQDSYAAALIAEIGAHGRRDPSPRVSGEKVREARMRGVDTIYFGGGTPSRTPIADLRRIAAAIREHFDVSQVAEWTLEANPEDVTPESLAEWAAIGIDRVSIGVQSFVDDELLPLGRIHGAARAEEAVRDAVSAGLRTSLDLILGLPSQTAASFRHSLDRAIALGAGHLSLYLLDLDEKTPLQVQVARGRTLLPEEDEVAELYVEAVARLEGAGLHQYEISNFARPGEESRHNLRYWRRQPYLGLGLGAHSFAGDRRYANTRDMHRYLAEPTNAVDFRESLGEKEARHERLFLRLRQVAGIHYDELVELCGQEGIEWTDRGLRDGWLRREGSCVAFTPTGFLLSNDYISQLF